MWLLLERHSEAYECEVLCFATKEKAVEAFNKKLDEMLKKYEDVYKFDELAVASFKKNLFIDLYFASNETIDTFDKLNVVEAKDGSSFSL